MLGSYVCKQCRVRLSRRIAPVRSPQWQPRATFLSLRNSKPQDHDRDEAAQAGAQPHDRPANLDLHNESGKNFDIRYQDPSEHAQPASQEPRRRYLKLAEDDVETGQLPSFQPLDEYDEDDGGYAPPNPLERGQGPASTIDNLLRKKDVDRAWAVFEGTYTSRQCEAIMEPALSDVALLNNGRIFEDLLREISAAFCKGFGPKVSPTEVLFRYEQLGLVVPQLWTKQALSFLTHQAIRAANPSHAESTQTLPLILSELLSLWRLFFQLKGAKEVQTESISTEWNLPAFEDLSKTYPEDRDFLLRLAVYHPRHVGNSTLGFCAAYFYTLSESLKSIESLHKEAEPLIQFLGCLLSGSYINPVFRYSQRSTRFAGLSENVQHKVIQDITEAPQKALTELGIQRAASGENPTGDPAIDLENFHFKRISRAVLFIKSPVELEKLWTEMNQVYTRDGKVTIPERLYNVFLQGYMLHYLPQRSIEVWNHMVANGIKPGIKSWVALLDGCVKSNNFIGFNEMWTRMLSTGIEPDNYAWTTRIHGLMSFRQVNLGLAALDTMGKRWISAEASLKKPRTQNRKDAKNRPSSAKGVNNCAKPSIEEINGAITAIVQINQKAMPHAKRVENIQKLLAWGANFSIKPDAITYNSMIQLYIRANEYITAFKVLRQMEKNGISADLATHNMLLGVTFDNRSFDSLSEDQQTERIISLFNELEAGGLEPNIYIYSTAINRLLKQYSNHKGARQIIDHMRERGKSPGEHIYVSLVTHYFQRSPPAIEAVDSLVEELFRRGSGMATDRMLFDRIIEGYATHDEIGKMMSVLTRMSKHNRSPSWTALIAVVEALGHHRDYDRIRDIARDVTSGTNIAKGKIVGGSMGEWIFFLKIKNLGIDLQEERMGDYMIDVRASQGNAAFQDPFSEPDALQRSQPREVYDALTEHECSSTARGQQAIRNTQFEPELGRAHFAEEPGSVASEQESSGSVPYTRDPDSVRDERRPVRRMRTADEEDVHGFLSDDHEDIHSRVDRP
jgi:pentatricopeptide repeat protein